jgi:hypothetical protein
MREGISCLIATLIFYLFALGVITLLPDAIDKESAMETARLDKEISRIERERIIDRIKD